MKASFRVLCGLAVVTGTLCAQSAAITGVVNPASNIPPGLPTYGIAQGSIFVIYGSNLGPATLLQATALPFPNTLGGTTVSITIPNGTPLSAPMYYTSAGQVAAVMPSSAPIGVDTMVVSYNGQTASVQLKVVASNFGISTDTTGTIGAVTFPDYSFVSQTKSAKPGDSVIIWGTGLGGLSPFQSDATYAPFGNLPAQIQVYIGGVAARVTYSGRSPGAVGLDQINVEIPPDVNPGCYVSVTVQTQTPTATVSNSPMIAVAKDNGTCVDPTPNFPVSLFSTLKNKTTPTKVLGVEYGQNATLNFPSGSSTPTTSINSAKMNVFLLSFSPSQVSAQFTGLNQGAPSLNSCFTTASRNGGGNGGNGPNASGLDGGASITVTPTSGGQIIISPTQAGFYQANLSKLASGNLQVAIPGGADVGPHNLTVPGPSVTWTNPPTTAIVRANGYTATWTGGDANSYVVISGSVNSTTPGQPGTVQFACSAPSTAGSLKVPSFILQSMPFGPQAFGTIQFDAVAFPGALGSISGFDLALDLGDFTLSTGVQYQ